MSEILYSNIQSKTAGYFVVCSARTSLTSRVVAGSNYEIVDWSDTIVAMPYVIRTTSGANPARYWAVDIAAGGFFTSSEAQAWIDVNGNGGVGSIECVPTGSTI